MDKLKNLTYYYFPFCTTEEEIKQSLLKCPENSCHRWQNSLIVWRGKEFTNIDIV